jgi:Mrp family chromosome partitioning ATPase/capsular polysaccharide biosynthesis protein
MVEVGDERHEGARLEDYLRILRERAWVVLACVVIVFVAALVTSLQTTPLYRASAEIVYEKSSLTIAVFGYDITGYDYDRQRTIETAIAAVGRNQAIAEDVKAQLATAESPGAEKSPAELAGMTSASASENNYLVSISAVSKDPEEAAAVANAFADRFILFRKEEARALVTEARDVLESELQAMTPSELTSDRGLSMQNRYESLRIMEAAQHGDFRMMKRANVPGLPFTPQTGRNVILALVIGLALGLGLAFLLEYLDKRIKDEKTLERVSGLPVLASVPVVGRSWRRTRSGERSVEVIGFASDRSHLLEAFRTLRSSLQYFNVDGELRKILVTSAVPLEGKTVTTVNLGISLALSGKRVIILEADLRRPMVHDYLGLPNEVGLSNVLAGASSLPGALQQVAMDPFIPARSRKGENGLSASLLRKNLYCITSGPLPPNPAELLQSARMSDVISELESMADYLLVDTPPVLPVSDAVTLAPNVDAVILAARLHSSTRDEIRAVRETLQRAGAHVIGVVAGGVKTGRGYYYKRGYHYAGYSYH